jgi:O-antigen/teichoic acid export membrane protein
MKMFKVDSKRTALIYKNVAVSFVLKAMAAIIGLLMVPLTLSCLGEYKNGVWLTISSMLVWIDQMDIGLGNGLRNRLAVCLARGDMEEARQAVSSTMAMLLCITVPMILVLSLLIYTTDIFGLLNVDESLIPDLRPVLLSAVILVCLTFVFKFVGNIYMAMQLPAVSNLILVVGQAVALIATWLLMVNGQASFQNIVIVNTLAPLLVYVSAYFVTFYGKNPMLKPTFSAVDMRVALSLGNLGLRFFWLQIASVVQFMTANVLISNFFSPAMVTPYTIAYRYFSLVLVAFTVVCMPFWSATTDAYERKDMQWIRQADRRMKVIMLAIAGILALMVVVSPYVYRLWVGDMCQVPFSITVMMAVYIFLLTLSTRYSYFINGVGTLRVQLYMTVMVIVFIPLAWYASYLTHDILYFMAVMCICIAPSVLVNKIQFSKLLKGTATGIWGK